MRGRGGANIWGWGGRGVAAPYFPGYEAGLPTLLENFETLADWSSPSTGTAAADATHVQVGAKSLLLTQTSGTGVYCDKVVSWDMANYPTFEIWVYVVDPSKTKNVSVFVTSSSFLTKYLQYNQPYDFLSAGWNCLRMCRSEFAVQAGEDWANVMAKVRVRLNPQTGQMAQGSIDAFYGHLISRPKCILTFDDGYADIYTTAFPIMRAAGVPGTMYVIGSLVGTAGYVTLAQLREMQAAGWAIASHTYNHVDLAGLADQAAIEAELAAQETWMATNGFTLSKHLAYPFGANDAKTVAAVTARGYLTCRTTSILEQGNWKTNQYRLQNKYPANTVTLAQATAWVDDRIAHGTVMLPMFHHIGDVVDALYWTAVKFQGLIDYLAARKAQIDCVTISAWWNGL